MRFAKIPRIKTIGLVTLSIILIASGYFSYHPDTREKLPTFKLLQIDSTTQLNTDSIPEGKPFVLVYFSPDCEHCQNQLTDILKNISSFRETHFYLFTPFQFSLLKPFYRHYRLYNYPNITIGYDYTFYIPTHFKLTSTPSLLIYNRKKQLDQIYQGRQSASELLQAIKRA
jgi:thioredoxin-related protein